MTISKMGSQSTLTATSMDIWQKNIRRRKTQEDASNIKK